MNELIELLYGERGILYRIESGEEDRVVSAEKRILLDLARKTNEKYHEGTLTNEELFVYIDVLDVLSSFQHVDWIRELTTELHSVLMNKVDFLPDEYVI
ncbi:MAG: hypothetical protein IJ017_02860 [Oscillospiraceae bacterium]|nr:hypothetical protein [Oscillospiraceae bacterium]